MESIFDYCYDGSRPYKNRGFKCNDASLCPDKKEAKARMDANFKEINELQHKLYADKKESVIFIFQAMDAAGKDGTIEATLQCLSPHGVHETAFKAPSSIELAHDFLWRIEQAVPMKGEISIFNRSQYEDVLIGKVKKLYLSQANARRIDLDKVIDYRYEDIVNYEKYLYHNNVRTVKIFLNVSKGEQAKRFLSRIERPEKNWKFSESDWTERQYWDEYMNAFEDVVNRTSSIEAPWYVVPADRKWYMRYMVSEIILNTLREMDPQYPVISEEKREAFSKLKEEIESELEPETSDTPEKSE